MNDNKWICDTCGMPIKEPEHGWVEWLTVNPGDGRRKGYGLRLVHHIPHSPQGPNPPGCQYDEHAAYERSNALVADVPLTDFVGPDGLMDLLVFLHDQHFPDQEEVLQMIKRLHVPGYEQTFRHFDRAIDEGVFEPNTAPNYYLQREICAVREWLEREYDNQ